jgi:glycyl-tRNA synthetase beta chain
VAVSLADKLDTLFAFFQEQMFPTGSKDPFALRRAGLGYLALSQQNCLQLELSIVSKAWSGDNQKGSLGLTLADFMFERLGVQLRDVGVRHDFIQASRSWVAGSETDGRVDRVEARARALAQFIGTEDGTNLFAGYKRAANILKQSPAEAGVSGAEMPASAGMTDLSAAELSLQAALDAAAPKASDAIDKEQFGDAMAALASLRGPIDTFFDGVMVNDPDPQKRAFRLGLLARFRDAVHRVADFSKIEG